MTTKPAPLLTAEMAEEMVSWIESLQPEEREALQALADGRTRCIQPLSEEEHRAEFEAWWVGVNPQISYALTRKPDTDKYMGRTAQSDWIVWLASRRAMGAVK